MSKLPTAFRAIPEGRELPSAFAESFGKKSGWIQAVGELEDVHVRVAGADAARSYTGRFTLAQLNGPIGGPHGVVLSRVDGERIEVIAGVLVRARVRALNALWTEALGEALVESVSRPGIAPSAWGAQAAARARALATADQPETEEIMPEVGDLTQHFAFGMCEVVAVEGDRLTLRDLAGTGRTRDIRTSHLRIEPPTEHDGKRLFKLSRR